MTFVHPWLVLGAALAAIPILLHVVARRRYRTVRWAAIELLQKAVREQAAHLRRSDRLLLLVRVAVLVVAPLVLARPVLTGASFGQPRMAAVVLLDVSGSMRSGPGGQTALDSARSRARELLVCLPKDAPIGLIGMGDRAGALTEGMTTDRYRLAAALEQLQPRWAGAQPEPALALAIQWLDDIRASRKMIYLVTDGRENVFTGNAAGVRALLEHASDDIALTALPVELGTADNLAITDLEIVRPGSPGGAIAGIRVRIAAEPNGQPDRAAVELWLDGRKADRRIVELGPASTVVTFEPRVAGAGLHIVEARLDPDGCAGDNRRFAAFHTPERMDVALVSPPPVRGTTSARTYLEAAFESIADVGLPWSVRPAVPMPELAEVIDDRLWLLVLADCGSLPAETARRIGAFIERGGACWVAGGRTLDETLASLQRGDDSAASWMSLLRRGGPPADGEREAGIQIAADHSGPTGRPIGLDHAEGLTLSNVRLSPVRRVSPATDSPWSVALRTSDEQPLLLTHANHRLALLTTSLETTATDWPYRPAFVTLVDHLGYWLCEPRLVAAGADTGSKWQGFAPASTEGLRIIRPDGRSFALAEAADLVLDDPGVYRFAGDSPAGAHDARSAVAVNVDPDEFRSPVWPASRIVSWLPAGPHRVIDPKSALTEPEAARDGGRELWPLLAAALLGLLLAETWLNRRFAPATEVRT